MKKGNFKQLSHFSNPSTSSSVLRLPKNGFTIVELLVVIVIIAILATITFVSYTGVTQKAAAATLKSDLKNASTSLSLYNVTNSAYPADLAAAQAADLLPTSSSTNYQYTLAEGNYCLSATSASAGSYAYHISSLIGTIEEGVCAGHTAPDAPTTVDIELLVVAGGGGGGSGAASANNGGGGGGGGVRYLASYEISKNNAYRIMIGSGGTSNSNGYDSSFGSIIATGGGGGGGLSPAVVARSGGSGGGGGPAAPTTGGAGVAGQGSSGANGESPSPYRGGGGGGFSEAGNVDGVGYGGDGFQSNISGSLTYYAGGGGGGADSSAGVGGSGGGGNGGLPFSVNPTPGVPNTGGGGGGGASQGSPIVGAMGGSGVVIVRYKTSDLAGYVGGVITNDGDYTVHTFTSDGTFGVEGSITQPMSYQYSGGVQSFTAPVTADYEFELWGASGGSTSNSGKGAYTSGTIHLNSGTVLYLYVGQAGVLGSELSTFNGGGGIGLQYSSYDSAYSGGGATDVRLVGGAWNLAEGLKSRIMVAGGGGGASAWSYTLAGGYAGGLNGGNGQLYGVGSALGGSQTAGGGFGFGQKAVNVPGFIHCGAEGRGGGGGGYYGGYAQQVTGDSTNAAGGGGSSFISGCAGCNAIDASGNATGQANHYSGYIFTGTSMIDGSSSMPNTRKDGNEVGHQGSGYILISWN